MENCPICHSGIEYSPPSWSGGRMHVNCVSCGQYQIAPALFEELANLPDSHWQLESVREAISKIPEPRVLRKDSTNLVHAEPPGAKKLTKLQKRSLRAKAQGKSIIVGAVVSEISLMKAAPDHLPGVKG